MVPGVDEIILNMTFEQQLCSVLWIGDKFQPFTKTRKHFGGIPKVFLKRFSE